MDIQLWLVAGLAAVDLSLVAGLYFKLRRYPPVDRRCLFNWSVGTAGLAFQAMLFFEGALLAVHLAALSVIYGLCVLQHLGHLSKHVETVARS